MSQCHLAGWRGRDPRQRTGSSPPGRRAGAGRAGGPRLRSLPAHGSQRLSVAASAAGEFAPAGRDREGGLAAWRSPRQLLPEYFDLKRLKTDGVGEIHRTYQKLREKRDFMRNTMMLGRIVLPYEYVNPNITKSSKIKIKRK